MFVGRNLILTDSERSLIRETKVRKAYIGAWIVQLIWIKVTLLNNGGKNKTKFDNI